MRIGVGYRAPLADWIDTRPRAIGCLEITAEHFFEDNMDRLASLRRNYPMMVHGLGLSLGTPGPLQPDTLTRFAEVCEIADPLWISEHIAFTRTPEVDLGHLNPVQPSIESVKIIADHASEVRERCGKPIILENITSHLHLPGDLSETEFLNRICEAADCGLLLDVTNLYINSRNHNFDPVAWIHELEARYIVQLHVVGYSRVGERFEDLHAEPIQPNLRAFTKAVVEYSSVQAIIVERDRNFPSPSEFEHELHELEMISAHH